MKSSRAKDVFTYPVGKCPLDDFPMDVDRGKINRTMTGVRSLKHRDKDALLRATQISETLYQHSKRMFDHALSKAGESIPVRTPVSSKSNRSFSGPTRAGSPIYNQRIQVMNAIRTRPVSVPASFVHRRGGHLLPIIKKNLAKSNEDFRIEIIQYPEISTCPSQRSSHPEVVLIPAAPTEEEAIADEPQTHDVRVVIQSEEAAKGEEEEVKVSTKAKKRVNSRRGSDGRRRPPRHWVDELTVSSIGSNHQDDLDQKTKKDAQTTGDPAQAQTADAADKRLEKVTSGVENLNTTGMDMGQKGETGEGVKVDKLPTGENIVLTLQELQDKQMTLPEFKCPSSEGKSREYAIREWLKHSTFAVGNRNVPLL